MRSENMAKNCPKCCQIAKFEAINGMSWSPRTTVVKATFNADVILRMRIAQRAV